MTLSLADTDTIRTIDVASSIDLLHGIQDTPAGETDRDVLLRHLGRKKLHGSLTRDFSHAYFRKDKTDKTSPLIPRMYDVGKPELGRCQYVQMTHLQYAAVLIVDIDKQGDKGGHPICLNNEVMAKLQQLVRLQLQPAWIGINPNNGHCQLIWHIDPVYADASGESKAMRLLKATTEELGEWLGHDPHFSHRFSRSPFYTGNAPDAYRWYPQHTKVNQVSGLMRGLREITGNQRPRRQTYASPLELLEAAQAKSKAAKSYYEASKAVNAELYDSSAELDAIDPSLINGVNVRWKEQGVAARDETAFRHALKIAVRLKQAGKRMSDDLIIDAYEHGYSVAQENGAAGRKAEMPSMRQRKQMAARVRYYAADIHRKRGSTYTPHSVPGAFTTAERKALATMGRRGGQKAAQRWETDRDGEYAQTARRNLQAANSRRAAIGRVSKRDIANYFESTFVDTGSWPTSAEAMKEFSVSRPTISRALKEAGITLPRGRRTSKN